MTDFVGAKAAFFCQGAVLAYLRDDFAHLPWPAHWDLPGGGREGRESPETCVLRELHEEFGLRLLPSRLLWRRVWPSITDPARPSVFFAGHLTSDDIAAIRFGTEGQHWQMMPLAAFLDHPRGIAEMQRRTGLAARALLGTQHPARGA